MNRDPWELMASVMEQLRHRYNAEESISGRANLWDAKMQVFGCLIEIVMEGVQ